MNFLRCDYECHAEFLVVQIWLPFDTPIFVNSDNALVFRANRTNFGYIIILLLTIII